MCAIPKLVSAPLNPIVIVNHFQSSGTSLTEFVSFFFFHYCLFIFPGYLS